MKKMEFLASLPVFPILILQLSGCDTGGETSNPYPFRVAAVETAEAGDSLYNTLTGRFYCDNLPDPSKCVFPGADAGMSGGAASGEGWDVCRCLGNYHLKTADGLSFAMDPQLLALGRILVPGMGLSEASYKGVSGDAKMYISKFDWIFSWSTSQYFLDVAGGFEGEFGDVKFSRGFFYSLKPQENR
jgi:hypothetical protein